MQILLSDRAGVAQAIQILRAGGVVAHATDTVWGLAADFTNPKAVQKIYRIKGSDPKKDLLVNVPNKKFVDSVGTKLCKFHTLAREFWPGPVAFVIQLKSPSVPLFQKGKPSEARQGDFTLGVRLPDHALSQILAKKFGGPLVTTSANLKGKSPATSAAEVLQIFAKQKYQPDLILDSGEVCKNNQPSTIVDVSDAEIKLLRAGAVSFSAIQKILQK